MPSTSEAAENPMGGARIGRAIDGLTKLGAVAWFLGLTLSVYYSLRVKPLVILGPKDPSHPTSGQRQTLLRLICEDWLPIMTIVAVILIVAGRLGNGLGLPGLFRDPSKTDLSEEGLRRRRRPGYAYSRGHLTSFLGALGATLLVAEVWTVIFYTKIIEILPDLEQGQFTAKPGNWRLYYWQLYSDYSFWNHDDMLWFLLASCLPFLGLLLLAELFPATSPGMERHDREFFTEVFRFVLGVLVGALLVFVAAKFGALLDGYSQTGWLRCIYVIFKGISFLKIEELYPDSKYVGEEVKISVMASFSRFTLMVLVFYLVLAVLKRRLSPGLGICMVLSFGILFYSVLAMLTPAGQFVLLGLMLLWFVYANGGRYKYRFPGMQEYYGKNRHVTARDLLESRKRSAEELNLLKNESVLENWRQATGKEKPKLVLVTTTGGAYRAAFWTTLVLDELGRHLGDDFHRHVRLMTGASGGMVGAAYYVSTFQESGPPANGVTDLIREETGLDSLTPVARRLVVRDLPMGFFWPFDQEDDRGIELERQWDSLARTFSDLSQGELEGWRPSLVVSPMVVESGRRLLISNLDLSVLAETRPLRAATLEGQTTLSAETARLYSVSAGEFFRIFPKARSTFSLQTAVRMSATFPLASPAVSLPTDPPRRVVDAGYYDNYGVDLATSWAYEHQDWIRKHTSGVALIQIRAYPSENDIQTYWGLTGSTTRKLAEKFLGRLAASFQGLTSPLAGGLNAREASMRFRNATQVRLLDDLFNRDGHQGFFETFVFENFDEFAMNWFISEHDIARMRHSIGGHDAHPSFSRRSKIISTGGRELQAAAGLKTVEEVHEMVTNKNLEVKENLHKWWSAPR